jgi:hypothetical protein
MKPSRALSPAALSPAARALLELGSVVAPPSAEQHARMDRSFARLIALERAAPPAWRLGSALPSLSAGRLLLAVGALAATAGASFWVGRASLPEGTHRVGATAAAVTASTPAPPATANTPAPPAAAEAPPPAAAAMNAAQSEPARPDEARAKPRDAAPPPAAALDAAISRVRHAKRAPLPESAPRVAAPQLGLSAEIQRLARAEAALRQGRPEQALVELAPPAAHLLEQATALRAIAECTIDREANVSHARETLARWPSSAFSPRIREACGL